MENTLTAEQNINAREASLGAKLAAAGVKPGGAFRRFCRVLRNSELYIARCADLAVIHEQALAAKIPTWADA